MENASCRMQHSCHHRAYSLKPTFNGQINVSCPFRHGTEFLKKLQMKEWATREAASITILGSRKLAAGRMR